MNTDPTEVEDERPPVGREDAAAQRGEPSEQELRAAYEAEISRMTSTDMILQAVVSLLNIGGYRLGLSAEQGKDGAPARDLEQVRDAIDGVRALMGILERREPESLRPLRDALSQLQMAYAREAGASAPAAQAPPGAKPQAPTEGEKPAGPGPAQSSGRLWVPGR